MTVFVHPRGLCESSNVGEGTRIWAFAHVLQGARIGRDCNICDHVFVEDDVVLGDRVTVKSGVQLWNGLRVGDDVFIGPNATFTNDPFPRSKNHKLPLQTVLCSGASLGANCTVLPGITIGRDAMVGAGAVVTHDVPARAIVTVNPARIVGYVGAERLSLSVAPSPGRQDLVGGAALIRIPTHSDLRGSLVAAEVPDQIPFVPRRIFLIHEVPGKEVRGEHAHRECHQVLVCVKGSVAVIVDDAWTRQEVVLESPSLGLYLPPMVWGIQYRYSADAILMVIASQAYNPQDYIRDYEEFLTAVRKADHNLTEQR